MESSIEFFIPHSNNHLAVMEQLIEEPLIGGVFCVPFNSFDSLESLQQVAQTLSAPYIALYNHTSYFNLGYFALERLLSVAKESGAVMLYSHRYRAVNGAIEPLPTIDYQAGSLRDNFDFGPLLLFNSALFKQAVGLLSDNYKFAALYDIRLRLSEMGKILQLQEFTYTQYEEPISTKMEGHFSYVDPKNREVQIEMERACTNHLKRIGGYLTQRTEEIEPHFYNFEFEASVIIPLFNRVKTLKGAIESALSQKNDFSFNVIVVDNHSTDGSTQLIEQLQKEHPLGNQLIHIVPDREDLKIGGCWNLALQHPDCGKFAIQLDSDDIYSSPNTLKNIVECFYNERCAMVVGSYLVTDFNLNEIPPGAVEHREWTPENGHNNALRINGLGAPRAFFTPILRELKLPNTSYGEDYAIGLRISREWKIGRIYDRLYLCRRWEGNSDSSLSVEAENRNNLYKDSLRTIELKARVKLNQEG